MGQRTKFYPTLEARRRNVDFVINYPHLTVVESNLDFSATVYSGKMKVARFKDADMCYRFLDAYGYTELEALANT